MTAPPPRLSPLGDSAITITLGDRIDPTVGERVRALADRIRAAALAPVLDVVPAYTALAVYYEPLRTDYETLAAALSSLAAASGGAAGAGASREHRIPVRYDGPDLDAVAERTGLAAAEVVERHSRPWYRVELLGFVPGFAYLGGLDPALVLPRRDEPRKRVPAGSVAIGGAQTGVYPLESPGGWHLIGRTDVPLFDPRRDPPALLHVGDRVRFEPIVG